MLLDAVTESPLVLAKEGLSDANHGKTAIVVCHGMGQQVRYETIMELADALHAHGFVSGPIRARQVLTKDSALLGRAEVVLRSGPPRDHAPLPEASPQGCSAHIYECYWAPLTEGRITLGQVAWFLARAGVSGVLFGLQGRFRRFLFNDWKNFGLAPFVWVGFFVALLAVAAVTTINAALVAAYAFGPRAMNVARVDWGILQHAISAFVICVVPFGVALGVTYAWWLATRRRLTPILAALLGIVGFIALGVTVVTGVVVLLAFPAVVEHLPGWLQLLAGRVRALDEGLPVLDMPAKYALPTTAVLFLIMRRFVVQYAGDVAIYLSSFRVSEFFTLRAAIQKIAKDVATAVVKEGRYDRLVFVGHSLGSVIAYDTVNALLNEAVADGTFEELHPKLKLLLTFGSPLDKTAFVFRTQQGPRAAVREALVTTMQPLIEEPQFRIPWINVWTPFDIVCNRLRFYDGKGPQGRSVDNRWDRNANIPLVAHIQYWRNRELAKALVVDGCGLTLGLTT